MERNLLLLAIFEQRWEYRRPIIRQRGAADSGLRVRPQNRGHSPRVVFPVILRREHIRTSAALTNVRFVGDFPVANPSATFPVVLNQVVDEFFPFIIINRLYDFMINSWEQ